MFLKQSYLNFLVFDLTTHEHVINTDVLQVSLSYVKVGVPSANSISVVGSTVNSSQQPDGGTVGVSPGVVGTQDKHDDIIINK